MRRLFHILAPGLVLVGLELSAQTFSTTYDRLLAGSSALVTGAEFQVPLPRFAAGLILVFGGFALTAVILWSRALGERIHVRGKSCPECGAGTRRIKRRRRQRIAARLAGLAVTRRQCEKCDWSGLAVRR